MVLGFRVTIGIQPLLNPPFNSVVLGVLAVKTALIDLLQDHCEFLAAFFLSFAVHTSPLRLT
jgi:hypothetical protein